MGPGRDPETGEPIEKPGPPDEASGEAEKVKPQDDGGGAAWGGYKDLKWVDKL